MLGDKVGKFVDCDAHTPSHCYVTNKVALYIVANPVFHTERNTWISIVIMF